MKISVLIVGHNEEEHIQDCIESILNQSQKPDEIIFIAHNCTDKTVEIAHRYSAVEVVEYVGPVGVPYARIKGFDVVTGDIVACMDGDAIASKHWLEKITRPLIQNPKVSIVGGRLIMTNNLFWRFAMLWQFFWRKFTNYQLSQFASGANWACRKVDYEKVGGIRPIIELKKSLPIYLWAEDYYISQALRQIGKLHIAWNAVVSTKIAPEEESIEAQRALMPKWQHDNNKILDYFSSLAKRS